ncbi:MAG: sugar phosphate isomerase/epimerase [Armatimonadetes bacterium]|nr:sugar phosphate isomerase/epimerase [Armatimonadota bacterium]
MHNILSCNLGSYGSFQDKALAHLASIGVKHVETRAPAPAEAAALKAKLAAEGLTATTVMAPCPVERADLADLFDPVFEGANVLGAKVVFVSAKAGETPLEAVYERLRAVGDKAVAAGVKVALETHPDLCDNGAKMVSTMAAIGHPGIGVNFDTANVYYYNEGVDAVTELTQALDVIVSVHLKDTGGGYKSWDFPTLGLGVVDFPSLFAKLNARGFYGPFTMELEGIQGEQLDEAGKLGRVADSVAYLRGAGLVP